MPRCPFGASNRLSASQQNRDYSITSSAAASRRGGLGGERAGSIGGGGNHRDMAPDRIIENRGEVLVATVQPMIFDDDILAFRKPGLTQAFAKLGGERRGRASLSGMRSERPSGRKTSYDFDEIASSHGIN